MAFSKCNCCGYEGIVADKALNPATAEDVEGPKEEEVCAFCRDHFDGLVKVFEPAGFTIEHMKALVYLLHCVMNRYGCPCKEELWGKLTDPT